MSKRVSTEHDRLLEERLRRCDERYEQISRMLLGETVTGIPGLLQRQINDENNQKENMAVLHEIKKDLRFLRNEITTLRTEFESFRGVFRLPTTKRFWTGVMIVIGILIILSAWTKDAYLFIWHFIQKKYLL